MTTRAIRATIDRARTLANKWYITNDDAIKGEYILLIEDLERLGWPYSIGIANELAPNKMPKNYMEQSESFCLKLELQLIAAANAYCGSQDKAALLRHHILLDLIMRISHESLGDGTIISYPEAWVPADQMPKTYLNFLWEDKPLPFHRVDGQPPADQRIPINWAEVLTGGEPHFV